MESEMLLAIADAVPSSSGEGGVVVGYGAEAELARFAADLAWTLHVPGHPAEARQSILDAVERGERAYIHVTAEANAEPRGTGEGFERVQEGRAGVVLAVGATLDPVLRATAGLDLTVLYAGTLRPFDDITLRTAVLAADHADVVVVAPGATALVATRVARTLVHVPHRMLSLDNGNRLEDEAIARAVRDFVR
ncbi:transketolase [Streptomyces blattellae]|uniref:transketolase n=1 Tax=Streptomyces blattellae TaxID=2569855 RepID=UPI0012B8DF24|nr:transketolase [Streptomyces blattellae]